MRSHSYRVEVTWNAGTTPGTVNYRAYSRDHAIAAAGKPLLPASSDPAFRGDASRYNPEELLIAALSSCHMLWYLHLCSNRRIVVTGYRDDADGTMELAPDGSGRFVRVTLRPAVTLSGPADRELAFALHEDAHRFCFIAQSVNFPVVVEPQELSRT
ncbi:MAG TPA: OsmC family protein [Candidatus Tumulicola sp.]|nr:OsmC family protein [Candidatus Tumulicola sp.]